MKTKGICYIIGAGEKSSLDFRVTENDIVIAADGGLKYCRESGIVPDVIIGDFDSFGSLPQGKEVVKLEPIKDVTDAFAAAETGLERGYNDFRLYCCTGGRLSHTLANIALLRYLLSVGAKGILISDGTRAEVCKDFATIGRCRYFSLFPCGDRADVTISGAEYSGDFTIYCTSSLGTSNSCSDRAELTVRSGEVIIITEY